MNDNTKRGPEWQRLVAEFFVPRLGGNHTAWAEANGVVGEKVAEEVLIPALKSDDYIKSYDIYLTRWLKEMADFVGVSPPDGDKNCLNMSREAYTYITERVHSAFPGAIESIFGLHKEGYRLFTASNEHSEDLDGYLRSMGVRQYFDTLYGPDLINRGKFSTEYYKRIFADAGVNPENSLVVDDALQNLAWAKSVGATTCLVSATPQDNNADFTVSSLIELPARLN